MPTQKPIRVPEEIVSLIRSLHPGVKRKIRAGLEAIIEHPETGKALRDDLEGLRSFRVGRFPIIYRVSREVLEVVAIEPRRTIYKETLRRLRQAKTE